MSYNSNYNINFDYYNNDSIFSAYAKHEQEKEDIIQKCIAEYQAGNYEFSIDLDDDMSENDLDYIRSEVQRRLR